jgi:electron-transferring-flavoprotein dehydrogenase
VTLIVKVSFYSFRATHTGNYNISLSAFTRWLASVAEEHYGVEIYPGFAGAGLLFSEQEDADDPWTGWEGKWGREVTKIGSSASTSASTF